MPTVNLRELKRRYDLDGPAKTLAHLDEALNTRKLKPEDFSIRALAEALIPHGSDWVRMLASRRGGFTSLAEAANAVDTSAFSSITGQIVYNKLLEGYNRPDFLHPELCETMQTEFLDGERVAGVGGIGDEAEVVGEAMPYPTAGVNEEYVDTPATVKRGFIVPVTKDIIIADRTGLLLKRCAETGYWLGLNKEKRVLDVVFGITNNYKRNGTSTNTYLTSGAYINSHSNTLQDWRSIENCELLLDAITDPNTGEPIMHSPDTIIVPSALKKTAERIVNATSIANVDTTTNTSATVRMYADAPKPFYGKQYRVLSSPYVKNRTSSASTWFLGEPKKSFVYSEVWKITPEQAGANSELAFTHDVVMRYKISERGVAWVQNPRHMVKST